MGAYWVSERDTFSALNVSRLVPVGCAESKAMKGRGVRDPNTAALHAR